MKNKRIYYGVLLTAQAVFCLLTPFITSFMGRSINAFAYSRSDSLAYFSIFFVGLIAVTGLRSFVKVREEILADKVVQAEREAYMQELADISWDQYARFGEGELLYHTFDLIETKRQDAFKIWGLAVEILVTILGITVNVILISPAFLWILFLLLPLCVWVSLRAADGCLGTHEKKVQTQSEYQNVLAENLTNIYSIHLNGDERFFKKRFEKTCEDRIQAEKEHRKSILRYQISDRICRFISELVIFLLACAMIWQGKLMVGWLMVLLDYGSVFFQQLSQLNFIKDLYQEVKVIEKTLEKVEKCPKIVSGNERELKKEVQEKPVLEVKQAVAAYEGNSQKHIYQFSLKHGEKVLLTGKSGSGKTTLFRTLARFLEMESGSIVFQGKKTKDLEPSFLRERIAYMPQKTYLFNGTILENILWGSDNKDEKQLLEWIKTAGLATLLYESDGSLKEISEFGKNISGGERQRIGILRMLMRDSDLYMFDEPFSNLDQKMKKVMMELILEVCKEKAVMIISHDACVQSYIDEVRDIYEISKEE